jgi:hypothetical protein
LGYLKDLKDLKDLKETTITNPHAARKHRPPSGVIMPKLIFFVCPDLLVLVVQLGIV